MTSRLSHHDVILLAEGLATLALLSAALFANGAEPAAVTPKAIPVRAPIAQAGLAPMAKSAPAMSMPAKSAEKPAPEARLKEPAPAPPAVDPAANAAAPTAVITSSDMPDTGQDYRKARRVLMNRGFKPARVAPPECQGPEPSVDACWGPLVQFPEIEACTSGANGSCTGWWVAPNGKVLKIRTKGDVARISDRHWASPGEIDELPAGWRP